MKRFISIIVCVAVAVAMGFVGVSRLPSTIWCDGNAQLFGGIVSLDCGAVAASGAKNGEGTLRLFGILPIKRVSVRISERISLCPGGIPFGIKMYSDGVMAVRFGDVNSGGKTLSPAKDAGIKTGDLILSVNGEELMGNRHLSEIVSKSRGETLVFELKRGDKHLTISVSPALTADGYKVGLWVRDSVVGIGTLTYVDEKNGVAAGLGHAISDADTGVAYPVQTGELVFANVFGLTKSSAGAPGELRGLFSGGEFASIYYNGETGIYGTLIGEVKAQPAIPIAFKQEIRKGDAFIYATLSGNTPEKYKVKIERIYLADGSQSKNMIVRITDKRLLDSAGGIVQGMSGSPIIQDGKLIGALTHVFVNDPTRGYGIFIENMLVTPNSSGRDNAA